MAVRREEVRVTADVNNFVTRFAAAGRAADGFANRLEAADGRLAGVIQTGLALAPAFAPIGASITPAVAGLVTQLGFAAVAAGSTALAFAGVGDAVEALDSFNASPTTERFEKVRETMDELGPAGQEFVLALNDMAPKFQQMQDMAQQGLFPGVIDGLQEFLQIMPEVQDVLFTTTTAIGDLAREAGQELSGPAFDEFFTYLRTTAAPVLQEMGRTFGNFVEGTANLVMAFDPLSRSFSTGLLDISRSFAEATANMENTQGFEDFVDYVRTSGPLALDALESVGGAFVGLVEAAAPVGQAVLPIISTLADTLAALAESPVGPVLVATAAGVGALGRSLAILNTVGLRGGGGGFLDKNYAEPAKKLTTTLREATAASRELSAAQANAAREQRLMMLQASTPVGARFLQDTSAYADAIERQRVAAIAARDAEAKRKVAIREAAATAGKAAATVGGLALATSGLADDTGLANTASMTLMGTIAGPWGAAIGAGIGLAMDFAAANDGLDSAIRSAEQASREAAISFVTQAAQVGDLRREADAYADAVNRARNPEEWGWSFDVLGDVKDGWANLTDIFSNAADEGQAAAAAQSAELMALSQGLAEVYGRLNNGDASLLGATNEELDMFANEIAPAAQAAGINLREALLAGDYNDIAEAVRGFSRAQEAAFEDSNAVASAMAFLEGKVQDVTAATDLNSDGVVNNTDAILANIQAMKDRADAAIAAFDAETAYAQALQEGAEREAERAEIQEQINDAQADGAKERARLQQDLADADTAEERQSIRERINDSLERQSERVAELKKRLADYKNTLDITTEAGRANRDVLSGMASGFNNLSDEAKNAPGAYEKARKALIDQAKQYGATAKEARGYADDLLEIPTRVLTRIQLEKKKAQEELDRFSKAFDGLDGKVAKAFIKVQADHMEGKLGRAGGVPGAATGGKIVGPGTGTSDSIPAYLSNGEWVIRAAAVNKYGDQLLHDINSLRFASGGRVGPVTNNYSSAVDLSPASLQAITQALALMRPLYEHATFTGDNEAERQRAALRRARAGGGR